MRTLDDLRLAARSFRRAKAFAVTAVLTLAVGIAATTTMFALIQGVLLRPLAGARSGSPGRVLARESCGRSHTLPVSFRGVEAFARESRTLEAVAAVGYNGANKTIVFENGQPTYVNEALISGRAFDVLGTPAFLGRALRPADDVDGAEPVVVITHALVDAAIRRRARRHRPPSVLRRSGVHDRRRDAAGSELSARRRGLASDRVGVARLDIRVGGAA